MPAISLRDTLPSQVNLDDFTDAATPQTTEEALSDDKKIVVVDTFNADPPHGEWVSFLAATRGVSTDADEVGKLAVPQNIDSEAGFIDAFNAKLKALLESDSGARVVNISSGRSPVRAVYEWASELLKWPDSLDDARKLVSEQADDDARTDGFDLARAALDRADTLIRDFDLEDDASIEDILHAVVEKVETDFKTAEMKEARQALADTIGALHAKGMAVVFSAGNHQQVADRLAERDVDFDEDTFLDNGLAQGPAIVVGATTRSIEDFFSQRKWPQAQPADFSNASGEVDIAADGTDIAVATASGDKDTEPQSGTSFAAPQVAALFADLFDINPDLSPDEALSIIKESALAPLGDDGRQLGAGLILPDWARHAAQARRDQDEEG